MYNFIALSTNHPALATVKRKAKASIITINSDQKVVSASYLIRHYQSDGVTYIPEIKDILVNFTIDNNTRVDPANNGEIVPPRIMDTDENSPTYNQLIVNPAWDSATPEFDYINDIINVQKLRTLEEITEDYIPLLESRGRFGSSIYL